MTLMQSSPPRFHRRRSLGLSLAFAFASGLLLPQAALASDKTPAPSSAPLSVLRAPVSLPLHSPARSRFQFGGFVGHRIDANVAQWLLPAPEANPGMIEMFKLRDRTPPPQLVPWAGEFVGKYLLSAIHTLRLTDNLDLENRVRDVVQQLIAAQAEDGYLGPFPKHERLLGHWDLWGHYHCLQALLQWHEFTGHEPALAASRRAADLACATYLDQPKRVLDAGSHEMNMAFIHVLGQLYRRTANERYLRLMREIESDWERAGDYLQSGLSGLEFFQTPRPRWESLHDLEGLIELHQITGQTQYRQAFEHHWRSILRWDRHNSGGFSTSEQAVGNPYAQGPIETCCTIAWIALSIDMLHLTGDPRVADEIELATLNAGVGAQHPSGRWWTYNTPMDGVREASAHSIVFQARAGTPELNCCSVNGPRALSLLTQWAVLSSSTGLVVNYFGPLQFQSTTVQDAAIRLVQESDYPRSSSSILHITQSPSTPWTLSLRIPSWSSHTRLHLNYQSIPDPKPGQYLHLTRAWSPGDRVSLDWDFALRWVSGDRECAGKAALYRGPLLLAYDQHLNGSDESELPKISPSHLANAKVILDPVASKLNSRRAWPWVHIELPTDSGTALHLCDFASAGAFGTRYRSWLPALAAPPPPPISRLPKDGAILPPGMTTFKWTTHSNLATAGFQLIISDSESFSPPLVQFDTQHNHLTLGDSQLKSRLKPQTPYYWKIVARNAYGPTDSVAPPSQFQFDPALPSVDAPELKTGPDGVLLQADLANSAQPQFGALHRATSFQPSSGPTGRDNQALALDGKEQILVYQLDEFPEEDYSVAVWFNLRRPPDQRLAQVFCAWAAPSDDPLRLVIEGGKLFARIEAGQAYSTPGTPIQPGTWHHAAAVKSGAQLLLYLDGKPTGTATLPAFLQTRARTVAIGGNPNFSGPEFLPAAFAKLRFYNRALSENEVRALATR